MCLQKQRKYQSQSFVPQASVDTDHSDNELVELSTTNFRSHQIQTLADNASSTQVIQEMMGLRPHSIQQQLNISRLVNEFESTSENTQDSILGLCSGVFPSLPRDDQNKLVSTSNTERRDEFVGSDSEEENGSTRSKICVPEHVSQDSDEDDDMPVLRWRKHKLQPKQTKRLFICTIMYKYMQFLSDQYCNFSQINTRKFQVHGIYLWCPNLKKIDKILLLLSLLL